MCFLEIVMIFMRIESNFSRSCLSWISADKSGKRTGAKIQNRKNRVDNRVSVSRTICTKAPWNLCEVDERDVFFPKSKLTLPSAYLVFIGHWFRSIWLSPFSLYQSKLFQAFTKITFLSKNLKLELNLFAGLGTT